MSFPAHCSLVMSFPALLLYADYVMKVWTLSQPTPAFTLDGHDKGVNSVDYFSGGMLSSFLSTCYPSHYPLHCLLFSHKSFHLLST